MIAGGMRPRGKSERNLRRSKTVPSSASSGAPWGTTFSNGDQISGLLMALFKG